MRTERRKKDGRGKEDAARLITSCVLFSFSARPQTRMIRVFSVCLVLAAACLSVWADETPRSVAVKKLSQELGAGTLKGDYAMVIDHTYDTLVKQVGGR